ncbi:MAG: enoyl-CoA hydratase-related protein, partial [Lysobacteraceae bacterium]
GDESFCTPQGTLRETASLELARAAVEQAMRPQAAESIELRDVEWLSAVPASPEHPVSIAVDALDAGGVGYEIYSASPEGERVHGRGEAVLLEDPARMRLDLVQLQSRMRAEAEGRRYRGDGEVLARVELSSSQRSGAEAYGLHPALLDGALDAARVLVGGDAVPASLSTLSVFAALPVSGWAWVRSSSTGVDVDLCDEQGAVCASLRGWAFAFRSATDVVVAMPGVEPASAEALQAEAPAPRMAPLRIALQTRVDAPAPSAPALEIEVARHKPTGVALIDPLSLSSPSQWSVSSKAKPQFGLVSVSSGLSSFTASLPAHDAVEAPGEVQGEVEVLDQGDGVVSIRIAAQENVLSSALVDALLRAFAAVRASASTRVVVLSGTDAGFACGGPEAYNLALSAGLHRAIATFPMPVIAAMSGDATGAGWWLGGLCDLMVCSEDAQYGYAGSDRAQLSAQDGWLRERFTESQARQLSSPTGYWRGAQLKASGWTCAIVPRDQVMSTVQSLAGSLSTKSALALRLLKSHLSRSVRVQVEALAPAELAVECAIETTAEVRVIRLDQRDVATVTAQLSEALSQCEAERLSGGIVLWSEVTPFDGSETAEQILTLASLIAASPVAVVAALGGDAQGAAWWLSLACDGSVYSDAGWYGAGDACAHGALAVEAAWTLPACLGAALGEELLLTGEPMTGAQLQSRAGG